MIVFIFSDTLGIRQRRKAFLGKQLEFALEEAFFILNRIRCSFLGIFQGKGINNDVAHAISICNIKLKACSANGELFQTICRAGESNRSTVIFPCQCSAWVFIGFPFGFRISYSNLVVCTSRNLNTDIITLFNSNRDTDCRLPVSIGAINQFFGVFKELDFATSSAGCGFDVFAFCLEIFLQFSLLCICLCICCFSREKDACDISNSGWIRCEDFFTVALRHILPINGIGTNKFTLNKFN